MQDYSKRSIEKSKRVKAIRKIINGLPLDLAEEILEDVKRDFKQKSWLNFNKKRYFDEKDFKSSQ